MIYDLRGCRGKGVGIWVRFGLGNMGQGVDTLISFGFGVLPLGSFRNFGSETPVRDHAEETTGRREHSRGNGICFPMEWDFEFLWVDLGGFRRIKVDKGGKAEPRLDQAEI
jgi:hypothetical protein